MVLLLAAPARAQDPEAVPEGLRVVIEGRIEAPLDRVRAVLLDLEAFGEWFPSISQWTVLERERGVALVHGSQDMPWPVRDRDYVVRYRWPLESDEPFELEAVAQRGALPAPEKGVVRLENLRTVWRLAAEGSRATRVEYDYAGDPGIPLPAWVASFGWERYTGVLIEALAARVEALHEP